MSISLYIFILRLPSRLALLLRKKGFHSSGDNMLKIKLYMYRYWIIIAIIIIVLYPILILFPSLKKLLKLLNDR